MYHRCIINVQFCIVLDSTKTIRFKPRQVILPLTVVPNHPVCPTIKPWNTCFHWVIQSRGQNHCSSLWHFREIDPCHIVLLTHVGIVGGIFSGHSFRRWGASFMLQMGLPGELIKIMADWRSDTYQRYLYTTIQTRVRLVQTVVKHLAKGFKYSSFCMPNNTNSNYLLLTY